MGGGGRGERRGGEGKVDSSAVHLLPADTV